MLVISSELAGVPREIQLIPSGSHRTGRGSFVLDEEGAASVMAAFDSQDNDMVIDYEHQTLRDVEAPAAGWITGLINKGNDGIWGEVQWNRRAVEYLNRREYRYLSPVFLKTGEEGRVVRLVNAALTNQPAIDGMVPVVAKQVMDTEGHMDFLEEMLTLLGLPEGSTAGQALAFVRDAMDALELGEGEGPADVRAAIDALKNGRDELASRVESLETKLRARDAGDLVSAAMKEGRITPAMKDWAVRLAMKDEAGFREFLRNQPVVVEMKEIAGGPDTGMSGDRAGEMADELIEQHMKDNPQAGYRDALLAVSARHPELFRKD
jgi:phage I-like protein